MRLAELLAEAGLPDGVFSVVHGDKEAVDAILDAPRDRRRLVRRLDAGRQATSTRPAPRTASACRRSAAPRTTRVVLPDADLDLTADGLVSAAYGSAGQRCMAVSVAVTVGDVAEPLLDKVRERIAKLQIGAGHRRRRRTWGRSSPSATTRRSPASSTRASRRAPSWSSTAATCVVEGHEGGYFLGPCVFDHVKPGMRVYDEEIFGPVLVVVRADSYPEALALVNDNPYGNGAAIFTSDGGAARAASSSRSTAGMVGVNVPIPVPMAYHSFGGWKALAVRRPARARPRRRALLHARQGRDRRAGPTRRRTPASTWASRRRPERFGARRPGSGELRRLRGAAEPARPRRQAGRSARSCRRRSTAGSHRTRAPRAGRRARRSSARPARAASPRPARP